MVLDAVTVRSNRTWMLVMFGRFSFNDVPYLSDG